MLDPRWQKLAELLVGYSLEVKPGDKVLVETFDAEPRFVALLIESIARAGGLPVVETRSLTVLRTLFRNATEEQMRLIGEMERARMERMDGYIGLRGAANSTEYADVPPERMRHYQCWWWRVAHTEQRVPHTRWTVLRWPTPAMAQAAGMSTEGFEEFYFNVCTLDYGRMRRAMEPLVARMRAADEVHITGPGTDVRFSIRGIPVIPCDGKVNVPDGECFTAPVRDSVEGTIQFNAPALYQGKPFDDIRLVFREGRIVEATSSDTPGLNAILDSDEGARYVGEFSLGFNPYVLEPMRDTLFDEKIAGSLHLTPGNAYEIADNGNKSEVHWDMVLIQRPEHGGGEIRFDGELIRKDGLFVPADLQPLNPDALLSS
jgi:aminopeptidase